MMNSPEPEGSDAPPIGKALAALRAALSEPARALEMRPDHDLRNDLGIDSMSLLNFAVLLQEALGVDMSPYAGAFTELRTVRDVEEFVTRLCRAS